MLLSRLHFIRLLRHMTGETATIKIFQFLLSLVLLRLITCPKFSFLKLKFLNLCFILTVDPSGMLKKRWQRQTAFTHTLPPGKQQHLDVSRRGWEMWGNWTEERLWFFFFFLPKHEQEKTFSLLCIQSQSTHTAGAWDAINNVRPFYSFREVIYCYYCVGMALITAAIKPLAGSAGSSLTTCLRGGKAVEMEAEAQQDEAVMAGSSWLCETQASEHRAALCCTNECKFSILKFKCPSASQEKNIFNIF